MSFRSGMPCCRHRVKMRCYDDSFTGREAVEWLHTHLQTTGMFGGVTRQQVRAYVYLNAVGYLCG